MKLILRILAWASVSLSGWCIVCAIVWASLPAAVLSIPLALAGMCCIFAVYRSERFPQP
jgi:hypothetical protein